MKEASVKMSEGKIISTLRMVNFQHPLGISPPASILAFIGGDG
jgi:hypothetical protein